MRRFDFGFVRSLLGGGDSLARFARHCVKTRQWACDLMDGKCEPRMGTVCRLADFFGVADMNAFFTENGSPATMEECFAAARCTLATMSRATGIAASTLCEVRKGKRSLSGVRAKALVSFLQGRGVSITRLPELSSWAEEMRRRENERRAKVIVPDEVLEWFGLERDPFNFDVDGLDDVLETKDLARAKKLLMRVALAKGIGAIVGPSGIGKTVVLEAVIAALERSGNTRICRVCAVGLDTISVPAIFDSMILALAPGEKVQNAKALKAQQVGRLLKSHIEAKQRVILVVDEAQALTVAMLRAIKRVHHFVVGFERLMEILLAGQMPLRDKLKGNPDVLELSQRCAMAELRGIRGEMGGYIDAKLRRAGAGQRKVFDADAIREMGKRESLPLRVNNLGAKAMVCCYAARAVHQKRVVRGEDVRTAAERMDSEVEGLL